ncbi:MAG: chromate efflux transporter [Betaproteobacteria bacterium]
MTPIDVTGMHRTPTFAEALRFWSRLGFISFGGPAGQIAIMHEELVVRRGWLDERHFLHALNYCMLLPGPEAQQLATYIGWLLHGPLGGIAAGLLFILPSVVLLIGAAWGYCAFGHAAWLMGLLAGAKPAVVAIIIAAAVRLGRRILARPWAWTVAVAAFGAIFGNVPFPLILAAAAVVGFAVGRRHPGWIAGFAPEGIAPMSRLQPGLRPVATLARVATVGLGLWLFAMVFLAVTAGRDGLLVRLGWFFTKAALLTFGGAYAVLPYVFQGLVDHEQWLTAEQMMDGLALGETTPGPLIMVVAFVGFVAAWNLPPLSAAATLGAIAGGLTAVFFTFLPSFVFILGGAPLVEQTRGNLRLAGPLAGITAAVVGVIASLGVFFAWHVLWPTGLAGGVRGFELVLSAAAVFALLALGWSVIRIVCLCAAAGLLHATFAP